MAIWSRAGDSGRDTLLTLRAAGKCAEMRTTAICDAIRLRVLVEFRYDGMSRIAEPHCFGLSSQGNRILRAYQTAGGSAVSGQLGWKLFDESKIVGIRLTDTRFDPRPDYNPADKGMTTILCRL